MSSVRDSNEATPSLVSMFTGSMVNSVSAVLDREEVVAGWGSCKSCDCSGYVSSGDGKTCNCGHHFSRHR